VFHLAVGTRVALCACMFLPSVRAPLPIRVHDSRSVVACRAPRRVSSKRSGSHSFEVTFSIFPRFVKNHMFDRYFDPWRLFLRVEVLDLTLLPPNSR
jgi:hypothetical protein